MVQIPKITNYTKILPIPTIEVRQKSLQNILLTFLKTWTIVRLYTPNTVIAYKTEKNCFTQNAEDGGFMDG